MSSPARAERPAPLTASAEHRAARAAARTRVLAAFAAVYVIWGSTYLAIRFAIETLPPLLMAGARFLVSGAILYEWAMWRPGSGARTTLPSALEWGWGAVVGALLLLGGNGGVVWAEQRVPSGIVALIVAVVPIWMVLLDWWRPGGRRPTALVAAGLATGFVGLVVLIGLPGRGTGGGPPGGVNLASAGIAVLGSLSWAAGSIISKTPGRLPRSAVLATAIEMLAGGAFLLAFGLLAGEGARLALADVTLRSALAWTYLVLFGSLVGFTAYIWLLGHVSAARASTYAYVNPVVAVFLGWLLAGEPVTARTLVGAAIIVGAVVLITVGKK